MKKNLEINISVDFRLVRLALVLLPFLCLAQELGSESIVLSTTYPSPVGVYARIITTGGAAANPMNTVLAQNAGNVIIGSSANPQAMLNVFGGIRPGDRTSGVPDGTCNSSTAGMMRYDSTQTPPAIEFCSNPTGAANGWGYNSIANAPVSSGLYGWCTDPDCTPNPPSTYPPAVCTGFGKYARCSCQPGYSKVELSAHCTPVVRTDAGSVSGGGCYYVYSCYKTIN